LGDQVGLGAGQLIDRERRSGRLAERGDLPAGAGVTGPLGIRCEFGPPFHELVGVCGEQRVGRLLQLVVVGHASS
jgi:hypothetical protein